ncbi:MAG TPA: type 2 isopentenyl-diphosphate Delta-isomerase [Candidatus Acidoferrales bacterium]|jgi:isopentenyl-diphosphate delta-isomerase|nr:type 2 isopentenyl-diphosphate Delta-isomerase [Candidatus Acidoferrales bacterium]
MTIDRKFEHLMLCAAEEVESGKTGLEDVSFVHNAIPEIAKSDIDLGATFLQKGFASPLFIAGMTGGHKEATAVNAALSEAAETCGIGIGVGSQRAAVEHPELIESYSIVRERAPSAFVVANIGAIQAKEYNLETIERLIDMVDADALAIHLNFLQEAVQREGDTNAERCLDAIKSLSKSLRIPIIAKETGAGISQEAAVRLQNAGASAIDVGGAGGTSWARVETYRARTDRLLKRLGGLYSNWGIPTAMSIVESRVLPVIGTGGIRNGLHIAKCVALGASLCGVGLPLLRLAFEGPESVINEIAAINEELRVAMFLTGCRTLAELKTRPLIITGKTKEMLQQRGFNVADLQVRR